MARRIDIAPRPFRTKEDAEEFARALLMSYPPQGYSTRVSVTANNTGYLVSGTRWSSCD